MHVLILWTYMICSVHTQTCRISPFAYPSREAAKFDSTPIKYPYYATEPVALKVLK